MTKYVQNNKFSAINNTEVMVFNENKTPIILPLNKISSSFKTKELPKITTKTNLLIQEFLFDEPIYIHSVNSTSSKITLNKIKSIVQYLNLKDMYKIRPYLHHPFDITYKNSIVDKDFNINNLDLQNINNSYLLKNNKYFGKRIDHLDEINMALDMNFGYVIGQWFSRGYIDKSLKQDPRFTWVSLAEDSHGLLTLIGKLFKVGIFHRGKDLNGKYDYIQIIDYKFNQKLSDLFITNKTFANWIYSAPYCFLNGLIYGIFFTNGTVSFNKDETKAYMTIKFLNQSLAERFNDLLNIRYNLQGVLSLVPDKKYCKVSYQFNKSFFKIIENGFEYGYIDNKNKKELVQKVKDKVELPDFDNNQLIEVGFNVQKLSVNDGYNFKIINSKVFSLLNGIMVPSI